ncbi:contractile injection system protein, VgrG/Pvc8 family [Paenibacillus jiagnxiensis]|uniref:contractile injection system protein, VgrG/Pvc8 family n=1 Tax=Paenibacillus jiagnxiensis TaxID=3228926 RepID=UPI0033B91B0C
MNVSHNDNGIGYESLRLYGPFQPQHIEKLKITRAINEHAYLHISGVLPEEQGAACIGQSMEEEPIVLRQLDEQGQSVRRLFHGLVTRMSVQCIRGVYTFELEAASHSYQMDILLKKGSFQDIHRTYDDLVTSLVRKYRYGDLIDTVTDHAKLGAFVLQYQETDWAFLKRLASRFGSVLVPEVTAASPKIFFGMPEGKTYKVEREVSYRLRKTFYEPDTGSQGKQAGSYIIYSFESLQYFALGDFVTLPLGDGKELVVIRAMTRLLDGLLHTVYDLQVEQDIRYARYENEQAAGIALMGKVLQVQQDGVQVKLDIDPEQDPAIACWFPVATRYVAEGHSGWYDMPEIGDQVQLYLPTAREAEAYVTDSLRQQRYTQGEPGVKAWRHMGGSGVEMAADSLTLSTPGEMSILLNESSGITISSPGDIEVKGGNVKLDAGQNLSLQAGTGLYLRGGASSMVLDGETDTNAPVIYQEGTVKAPVYVADLPPVPEPPLMSIKAYEAAQAAKAESAASAAARPSVTAKVTTPAELQQANSLLGTVSKLLGSIPAMGAVAGAAMTAGPRGVAVGAVLMATAAIPVRSTGTASGGVGSKGTGIHPLKHLADLALQGLISQYEHEQAKQAYYNKWILGKVYTSARHIAQSGGPLELVQNLLTESTAITHAYQQVPQSVRNRWIRQAEEQELARLRAKDLADLTLAEVLKVNPERLKHIDRNAEGFYIIQNYYLVWERGTRAFERPEAYLDGNYFLIKKLEELYEQGQDLSKLTVAEMDRLSLEAASKLHKASSLVSLATDISGSRGMSSGFSNRYSSNNGSGGTNPEPVNPLPSEGAGKPKWWHPGYVDNLTDSQIILGVKQSPKGLSTLGSSTRKEAMNAGKGWVGEGAKEIIDKTTGEIIGFSSADGMRAFRIQFKPGENMVRANFQENIMIRTERNYNDYNKTWAPKQIRNVHIDILD